MQIQVLNTYFRQKFIVCGFSLIFAHFLVTTLLLQITHANLLQPICICRKTSREKEKTPCSLAGPSPIPYMLYRFNIYIYT